MKTAIAYLRWSTESQDLSAEAQRAAIARWAASNDVTIVAWHEDAGVSGGTPIEDRPGLLAATAALEGAAYLVVAKRDRLARDVLTAAMVERICQRAKVALVSADGAGNGTTPEAALMRAMIDAFAAYERLLIGVRTKAALAAARARGVKTGGSVPYGKVGVRREVVGKDGKPRFVRDEIPCETELLAIGRARALRRDGCALRKIGDVLFEEGHRPRKGATWQTETIRRMVTA